MSLSDFSLHSIGIILDDLIIGGGVKVLSLNPEDILKLIEITNRYGLDFDDAYQYSVAEKFDLEIISFDDDFDKTRKGRREL